MKRKKTLIRSQMTKPAAPCHLSSMKKFVSFFILLLFYFQLIYSQTTIPFRFRIITWNVGNSEPNCETFRQLAFSSNVDSIKGDLIVFGFQESAKKVFGSYSLHKTIIQCLQNHQYTMILSDYVGSNVIKPIWLYLFVTNVILQSERLHLLTINGETTLKVYQDKILENIFGYKGIIASQIQIDNVTNLVFVNMHLPAGEGKLTERCQLLSKFFQTYQTNSNNQSYMFILGDQNWRTMDSMSIADILQAIQENDYQNILNNDELTRMRQNDHSNGLTQCLRTFYEAPITFPPTYKYVVNTDIYLTMKDRKDRRPSYTDRILVSNMSTDLQILRYSSMNDIKMSDHRPVFADFLLQRQTNGNKSMQQTVNILEVALVEINNS
ncbi:unnamed protein product [Adineta ricciae]|uniref:Inositol polyphosphate-related phosphatase domain-containing protein n=1 Tax=Adineta ricciae TaxID=249248 RepID=A0A813ZKY7_ADIRI|nr:unnamed protein product [Adineta ricciae]